MSMRAKSPDHARARFWLVYHVHNAFLISWKKEVSDFMNENIKNKHHEVSINSAKYEMIKCVYFLLKYQFCK